jgi:alpha-glucosidase
MTPESNLLLKPRDAAASEPESTPANRPADQQDWWRGAVIYQVYPRSFQDTSGNGVGDLQGVVQRLPYIASLGVDGIWVSPFFKSPMKDFGYDVSDFTAVDPLFGSIDDFKALIKTAHEHNLKVIIDQVLSHTSDQHEWFQESRQDKTNARADWYVWDDAPEDGAMPNNWMSIFGGSAWSWDEQRQQYYLHNFLTSQPDLNYHCPAVREQVLQEMAFWLDLGVDGFRLDAINFCYHDAELRSNPIKPMQERKGRGFSPDNPYAAQYHKYDSTQPENLVFLQDIRALTERYPGTVLLGEVNSDDSLSTMAEYTSDNNKLHMAYSFELLADEFGAAYITETVAAITDKMAQGWPCWAVSNHDVQRVVTRWGKNNHRTQFAKTALALAASLRGTVCVYQGEELGLCEAPIEHSQLQDPFGIAFWPEFKGRDGCRTPMPWHAEDDNAGFTCAQPWLPIPDVHKILSVAEQELDQDSVLNFYRRFLAWRKEQPGLIEGNLEFLSADDDLLVFKRALARSQTQSSETIVACFNLSHEPKVWQPETSFLTSNQLQLIHLSAAGQPQFEAGNWHLPACSFALFKVPS